MESQHLQWVIRSGKGVHISQPYPNMVTSGMAIGDQHLLLAWPSDEDLLDVALIPLAELKRRK